MSIERSWLSQQLQQASEAVQSLPLWMQSEKENIKLFDVGLLHLIAICSSLGEIGWVFRTYPNPQHNPPYLEIVKVFDGVETIHRFNSLDEFWDWIRHPAD